MRYISRRIIPIFSSVVLGLAVPIQGQPFSHVLVWGDDSVGQTNLPPSLTNVVAVASGYAHNLALRANGTVSAWGYNSAGQINVAPGLSGVVAVTAGFLHSLALKGDGTLAAWGYGGYSLNTVPAGLSNVVAIGSGAYHNLVITANGSVTGWGNNGNGQLNFPAGLSHVTAVAGGLMHSTALKTDGTVIAWGNNSFGQLNVPPGLANVVAIAAGDYHNLALCANGTVVAWGYNNFGQLNVPPGLSNVVAIACGYFHSLALKADGTLVGWGNNSSGQSRSPAGLTNVVAISAGSGDSLALVGSAPAIISQPHDLTATESSSAVFAVGAVGLPRLAYQWRFDGTNLPGCTQASLTISNVHVSDAGSYSVRVSNPLGSVTSSPPAMLSVAPSIVARCASVVVAAGSNCSASASIDGGSYDPDGGPVTLTQSPPGPYPLGTNVVALTVSNSRGGSASCTALVIVLDRTPPVLVPPQNIVAANDPNQCGAVVSFAQPSATDACSPVTLVTCSPPSGTFFPVGTTVVQCSATDAAGNVTTTNFTVTVLDLQPPTLICPGNIVVTNAHDAWTSVVTFNPVAQDNCSGVGPVVCSPPSGTAFAPGAYTVNCSVADGAGNSSSCSFHIAVWPGNVPPVPVIELSPLVNLPGYTNLTVIAPDGIAANVTCDGSRSHDPDDPTFLSEWFVGTNLFSTNLVTSIRLPVGLYTMTLVLDDTFPYGRSAESVQVEVLSPEQAIGVLENLVLAAQMSEGNQRALLASLDAAVASAEKQHLTPEINQLGAFENKVRAQLTGSDPALATELLQSAQQIVQAISP